MASRNFVTVRNIYSILHRYTLQCYFVAESMLLPLHSMSRAVSKRS